MAASEVEHGPLEPKRGVLDNRKAVVGILAFCLYASVAEWRSAMKNIRVSHRDFYYFGHHFSHDPIYVFALVFSVVFLGNIVLKSPLRADRFVFGAAAFSLSLSAMTQFTILNSSALWTVRTAHAIAWTIAASICLRIVASWGKADEQPIKSD